MEENYLNNYTDKVQTNNLVATMQICSLHIIHYSHVFALKPVKMKVAIVYILLRNVGSFTFYDPAVRKEVFSCFLRNTVSWGPWLH